MKRFFIFFLVCLGLTRFPLITGCANIVPPTGGPRDSLPPVLVKADPSENALHVSPKKIILNFDEYLDLKEIRNNLIVSPVPKIMPTVTSHLRTITIEIRDTLQPNTTYALNFGRAVTDVNEGNILKNFTYVFSTGNYIDSLRYSGRVIMAYTGKPDSKQMPSCTIGWGFACCGRKAEVYRAVRQFGQFQVHPYKTRHLCLICPER
jgi:hypothetical protein